MVRGTATKVKDAVLSIEGTVLSKINPIDIPIVLFAAYYVFNIKYKNGTANFYSFSEVIFINATPPKRAKLNHFINMIEHVI